MNISLSRAQLRRIRGTLGAALALVPPLAVAQSVSAPLAVQAIGLPDGCLIMEHQEPALHVTDTDVARGDQARR